MESRNIVLSIILPTFNERGNIVALVERIKRALSRDLDFEILFVDDSTDNTHEIIAQEKRKDDRIRLIRRREENRTGLATAVIRGIDDARGEYVVCLDSDLQHPPEIIPALLEKAILEKAHIVVGARYLVGGGSAGLGSAYRRFVSLAVKYFTQIIFIPTRLTTDPGSGLFLFQRNILGGGLAVLRPIGFKILIEILVRGQYDVTKVFDVPYSFQSREAGSSKANFKQGTDFIKHLWLLFSTVPEAGRFIKFCIVGGSGVVVNLGILYILAEHWGVRQNLAWFIAVSVSIFNNFILNSLFTYSDKKSLSRKESIRRMMAYYALSFVTILFNFSMFRFGIFIGLNYIVAALFGILFSTAFNFILVTKVVWRKIVSVAR